MYINVQANLRFFFAKQSSHVAFNQNWFEFRGKTHLSAEPKLWYSKNLIWKSRSFISSIQIVNSNAHANFAVIAYILKFIPFANDFLTLSHPYLILAFSSALRNDVAYYLKKEKNSTIRLSGKFC